MEAVGQSTRPQLLGGETRPVKFAGNPNMTTAQAASECFHEFARERPEVVAMWAFGLGFVLGWKLRIW